MAHVYHARDLNLQREVAIKLLREDLIADPAFQARFLQEARAAANLLHPNIVTVYDFGHDAGRMFIAMEYVAGHRPEDAPAPARAACRSRRASA